MVLILAVVQVLFFAFCFKEFDFRILDENDSVENDLKEQTAKTGRSHYSILTRIESS
jgi:hypothetical protein